MARIIWLSGAQHNGKTQLLARAAPPVPGKCNGSCIFSPSDSVRQQVRQQSGFTPISVITALHDDDFPVDHWAGANTLPTLAAWIKGRIGSMTKPPSRAMQAGKIVSRANNVWTISSETDAKQDADTKRWAASVAYWKTKGWSTTDMFFWAPPGSAEGELADLWVPHSVIHITDWQRIQDAMEAWRGFVKTTADDKPIDYMAVGSQLTPLVMKLLAYLEKCPVTVLIDGHPKMPGTRMGSSEVSAGGPYLPTREGLKKPISTMAMAALLRPPNAEVSLARDLSKSGPKVDDDVVKAGVDFGIEDLVASTVQAVPEILVEAGYTSVIVFIPPDDPLSNRWLCRDREKVLSRGANPGSLYGLYYGSGHAASYFQPMPDFIDAACAAGVTARTVKDIYSGVGSAVTASVISGHAAAYLAAGQSEMDREAIQYNLTIWAICEAYAAFFAVNKRRSRMSKLSALVGG